MRILEVTESQYLGLEKLSQERAALDVHERRFLAACLTELGGKLTDPWQYDPITRRFWMDDGSDSTING